MQEQGLVMMGSGGDGGGSGIGGLMDFSGDQYTQLKAEIATHPLYDQLLAAHVACLRVATPIDQLPLIDAQLSQSQHLLRSYASQHHHHNPPLSPHERQELDNFLAQYMFVLCSFKEQLQQHVRVHAVEAVMACREIEQNLQALTDVRQQPKNFRKSFYLGKDLKKLLDLPIEKRKAPLLLNFIPTYTSKLADTPRKRKKSTSPSTASAEQVASTSEPADQPSTSAPHSIPVQEKKRRRRLVKTAEMEKPKKKVLNLLADLPKDMEEEPAQTTTQPKPKRVKKAQPKAKVTDVDADEDAVPISKLTEKTTSAPSKRPAEVHPPKSTAAKKQKSAAGTSSGPKIPWAPKITLEDRPVYAHESSSDINVGVALSMAVLIEGDLEKNSKVSEYENYALMLQRSVQTVQHAHAFSVKAFETREELTELKKEFAALQKTQKKDQVRMKQLEEQAEAATKAQSIALQKVEAAVNVSKVAEAEKIEAEAKRDEAQKELRDALATKEADLKDSYNRGMDDVAEDYRLQVKQACNQGFVLGWNALAKKLDLPVDSPWRKTEAMRLPCPLPPSEDESESEAEDEDKDEDKDEALVRKPKSPTKIDLTGDEEVEAVPKKTDFGTLTSDLLLIGRSVEETVAEIDAEVAAEKQTEVTADKPAEASENKEAEVVVEGGGEVVPQPTPEAEVTPEAEAT